jgi:octaprenyl-diphosphate synthase
MALSQGSLEVVRLLCDCTLRLIEGELYQLTKTGDASITEAEHFEIIRHKTAYLFAGCAEIGGMLGSSTPEQRAALRDYGFDLGLAFQIVDDVLDYTADETALGKPLGGDLREGKVTLPIILLLERGGAEATTLVHGVVASGQVSVEQWQAIKDLLARHGAVDAAFGRAVEHADRAKQRLLDAFPASPERDGLVSLADYVIQRDR